MSDNIIRLCPEDHRFDIEATTVLEGAMEADLAEVTVMGVDRNGREFFASSKAYAPDIVWALERLKARLLRGEPIEG